HEARAQFADHLLRELGVVLRMTDVQARQRHASGPHRVIVAAGAVLSDESARGHFARRGGGLRVCPARHEEDEAAGNQYRLHQSSWTPIARWLSVHARWASYCNVLSLPDEARKQVAGERTQSAQSAPRCHAAAASTGFATETPRHRGAGRTQRQPRPETRAPAQPACGPGRLPAGNSTRTHGDVAVQ